MFEMAGQRLKVVGLVVKVYKQMEIALSEGKKAFPRLKMLMQAVKMLVQELEISISEVEIPIPALEIPFPHTE